MEILSNKARRYLEGMEKASYWSDFLNYKKAICFVCLKEYDQAQILFQSALINSHTDSEIWAISNQPDLLVDICLLSGEFDLVSKIHDELSGYIATRKELYYPDYYALILESFSANFQEHVFENWVAKLLEKPSVKEGYEIGRIAQSMIAKNQSGFDVSLQGLLRVHDNMAKRGGLRETPEGLFCLKAMSLAHYAIQMNLDVNYGNFFLPTEYLEYLLKNKT